MADQPRYTFVWWGDGYAVYDGEDYIGKDDQINEVDLMERAGIARTIDAEERSEVLDEYWGEPLSALLAALETGAE